MRATPGADAGNKVHESGGVNGKTWNPRETNTQSNYQRLLAGNSRGARSRSRGSTALTAGVFWVLVHAGRDVVHQ